MDISFTGLIFEFANIVLALLAIIIPILLLVGFVSIYANTRDTLTKIKELEQKIDNLNK